MPRGIFANISFCPNCGVESIATDPYGFKDEKAYLRAVNQGHIDWVCTSCGLGFTIGPSRRHQFANVMFKAHRLGNFMDDLKNKNGTWAKPEDEN